MIKFGTGGWRALIGEEFTRENVQLLSQAMANIIKDQNCQNKGFVVGYDRRFLSDKAARWIAEVLAGNGVKVLFVNEIAPTPLIMFTVNRAEAEYGAAVTASHNPADYNGIKIFTGGGRDATEDTTKVIEDYIARVIKEDIQSIEFGQGVDNGRIQIVDPFNTYIDTVLGMLDIEAIKKRRLKILLDPMYGVSRTCLQAVLVTARCELDIINDRHDTLFGGRLPSPNTQTLQRLRDMVVEKGYDIGIGTDGDADRLGIIDKNGDFIHPNNILALLYYYLLKYKGWKGGAVRNLATTHLLDKIARDFGEECYEVPVGFKHISSMMEARNALIGGESSGGLTIRGHIKGKDGIFAAGLLVEMLSVTEKSLSDLLKEIHEKYGYFHMVENDFRFSQDKKTELMKTLFTDKLLPDFGYEAEMVSYSDGVKVYFKDGGWIIVRFSGTESLLRVFAEMDSEEKASIICEKMKEFFNI
ncbi:phosphoglucomutase/phosphomannomutase family protein [Ruminiclostridium cellobioparum]|uniref:Phosphoglucomutase n=1 Tax=Ruminiclostridium cellobioparum subsp. termitidis CT1112 TaxID=1195236 RepID=S0FFB0_RUMCE|nr:phosphoglucomutase/phosphomannomutase family protein [Ruminiclostridium cellobioparum]EMS69142.1 Phosphomannomutase [Ruminiclostridium cellobioparum subsp. termitidis CT1112]